MINAEVDALVTRRLVGLYKSLLEVVLLPMCERLSARRVRFVMQVLLLILESDVPDAGETSQAP